MVTGAWCWQPYYHLFFLYYFQWQQSPFSTEIIVFQTLLDFYRLQLRFFSHSILFCRALISLLVPELWWLSRIFCAAVTLWCYSLLYSYLDHVFITEELLFNIILWYQPVVPKWCHLVNISGNVLSSFLSSYLFNSFVYFWGIISLCLIMTSNLEFSCLSFLNSGLGLCTIVLSSLTLLYLFKGK